MLTPHIKQHINESLLCWLATADENNQPNVSPREYFICDEANGIIVANIASLHSTTNIKENSKVCASFVDMFTRKGYKVTGNAELITPFDTRFKILGQTLFEEMNENAHKINQLIQIHISKIELIASPTPFFAT